MQYGAELEMKVLIQKECPKKLPTEMLYIRWKCAIVPRIVSSATRPFLQVGGAGQETSERYHSVLLERCTLIRLSVYVLK